MEAIMMKFEEIAFDKEQLLNLKEVVTKHLEEGEKIILNMTGAKKTVQSFCNNENKRILLDIEKRLKTAV